MKFLYLFLSFLIISCSTTKNNYVCGDRPCIDKKDFDNYFSKNLIVELIHDDKKKKNQNVDLINLNILPNNEKKLSKRAVKKQEKLKKKVKEEELKAEKNRLLKERKIKENEKKKKKSKTKQIVKIPKLKNTKKEITNNKKTKKKNNKNFETNERQADLINDKNINIESVCSEINDCDIDKIAEILSKNGRDKPFPNITSN